MQQQQIFFPRGVADLYNAQRAITPAVRIGNFLMTAHNGVRLVTHYPVYQPQPNAVRQLNLTPLAAKGPTTQVIGVKQFNTGCMAARPGKAFMTAGAVKNAMNMQLKGNGHLKWNLNHTSVWGANRGTFAPVGVSETKTPQSAPVPASMEGTQERLFPGGNKCGVAVSDGEIFIRGPATELLTFKNMLNLREGVHFSSTEEESTSGRLVAIDFDKTIAEIFLWAELGGLEGADAQLRNLYQWCLNGKLLAAFGGQKRVDELRAVLQQCKDRGDLVCILSSGYAKVIRPALRLMKLDDIIPDELVYGSDTWPFGISKSQRIDHLKRQHSRPRATLVDDDVGYCRAALQDGHDVIWVKNGAGAQKREFDALLNHQWDRKEHLTFL